MHGQVIRGTVMFNIDPISTTNIISIIQLIAVIGGFYFSWKALNATRISIGIAAQSLDAARANIGLATQNAQVQLYSNLLIQGRALQLKFLDDHVPSDEKVRFFMAIIIAYYASCFELRRVLSLPQSAEKLLDNDVRESMRDAAFRSRFEELRNLHSIEFGKFVDGLRGVS
jgi:hypothetical protein